MKANVYLIISFSLLSCFKINAQNLNEFDQNKYDETLAWLEKRLTYNYYNATSNVHWSNRFFYNKKNNTISLRSVSTYSPNAAQKKKVLDRTVRIDHLDASSINLSKVEKNRGRIVEGTLVEITTIGQERGIQRSFNGQKSLKEFKLEIPIPKYYEDSVQYLSNGIKEKFATAIGLASKIYASADTIENIEKLQEVFTGSFKGDNGIIRNCSPVVHSAVESEVKAGKDYIEKEIIGFNKLEGEFFRWTIDGSGNAKIMKLQVDLADNLTLYSTEKSYKLVILGLHNFTIEHKGETVNYHRSSF